MVKKAKNSEQDIVTKVSIGLKHLSIEFVVYKNSEVIKKLNRYNKLLHGE